MDTSSDPRVRQTVDALREAFAGSPWAVEPTPEGARVGVDIVDARWWELLRRDGLREVYTFTVRFDPVAGTCAVTDELRTLDWTVGVDGRMRPSARLAATVQRGRVVTVRKTFVATPFEGVVVDSTFHSETGRATLRRVLDGHGWTEKMGRDQRIGLWFAVGGIAVALVAAAVAVVVSLG